MYIKKKRAKGKTYYAVVKSVRDKFGRVKQITVAPMGPFPTIPEAIHHSQMAWVQGNNLLDELTGEMNANGPVPIPQWPKTAQNAYKKIWQQKNMWKNVCVALAEAASEMGIEFTDHPEFIKMNEEHAQYTYSLKEGVSLDDMVAMHTHLETPVDDE